MTNGDKETTPSAVIQTFKSHVNRVNNDSIHMLLHSAILSLKTAKMQAKHNFHMLATLCLDQVSYPYHSTCLSRGNQMKPIPHCFTLPRLHGEVASPHHVSAIHKVSSCCSIERGRQRRARSMRIRAHSLRVVQGIACCIHWGTIREVANRVGEVRPWQWRSWSVRVWSNSLRVVDAVAGPVQWCAVWQVASCAAVDTCCQSKITY